MASKNFQTYNRTTSDFQSPTLGDKTTFSQGIGFTSYDESMWERITTELSVQGRSVQTLEIRVARLENMFQKTMEKIDVLISMMPTLQTYINPKQISLKEAKEEIKEYFSLHHGKDIYWSDLVEALNIDLETVIEACNELEKEEKICASRSGEKDSE